MRNPRVPSLLSAVLMSIGAISAQAAEPRFYDPSNVGSPSGVTVGSELFGTIGCPGRGLLDAPCAKPTDSDGDGVVDGKDKCPTVYAKTADGCPPVAALHKKLILEDVNFDNDKATLRPDAAAVLNQAVATLKEWGKVKVEVAGYTDSINSVEYNLKLSQSRAETVRDYLIGKGIAADRLTAKGYGEANPVGDNATEAGRAQNRRVELVPQE